MYNTFKSFNGSSVPYLNKLDKYQHQIHHRGQAHAMLSDTGVAPPQLDEFFAIGEAPLRAQDFTDLGWTEETVWGPNQA